MLFTLTESTLSTSLDAKNYSMGLIEFEEILHSALKRA